MLICEMAAFYRTKGISLIQARENMYKKYGVYVHSQSSFVCEGVTGMERMKEIMSDLRTNTPKTIGGLTVTRFEDYLASTSVDTATGAKTMLTLPQVRCAHIQAHRRRRALSFVPPAQSLRSRLTTPPQALPRQKLLLLKRPFPMILQRSSVSDRHNN